MILDARRTRRAIEPDASAEALPVGAAGGAPATAGSEAPDRSPAQAKLGIGLDVDVEPDGAGAFAVQYSVLIWLYGRVTAACRLEMKDGRDGSLLAEHDADLRSDRVARVHGRLRLAGEMDLICEARLVDDPAARGWAFAWITPAAFERRARKIRPDPAEGGQQ